MPPIKKISNVAKTTGKSATPATKSEVLHNTRNRRVPPMKDNQRKGVKADTKAPVSATPSTRSTGSPRVKKVVSTKNKAVTVIAKNKPISSTIKANSRPQTGTTARISTNVVQTRNQQSKRGVVSKPNSVTKKTVTANPTIGNGNKRKQIDNSNVSNQKAAKIQIPKVTAVEKKPLDQGPPKKARTGKSVTNPVQHGSLTDNPIPKQVSKTSEAVADGNNVEYLSNQQGTENVNVVVERVVEDSVQNQSLFDSEMVATDSKSSNMLAKMLVGDSSHSIGQSEVHDSQIFIQTVAASVEGGLPKNFIQSDDVFIDQNTNQNYSVSNKLSEETIISSNEKCSGTVAEEISNQPVLLTSSTPIATQPSTQSGSLQHPDTTTEVIRVEPTDLKTLKSAKQSSDSKTSKSNEYDEVFDNVSGIIKDTILSIPGMRYFILSKLPSITGILASQTGNKVALSGSLMALLSSWKLLEKMSKLFGSLCNETSKDHSYSDKILGYGNRKKDSTLDNMSSLAKLTLVLQQLINDDNVPVDDALDDRCLPDVIKMVKQKIIQDNTRNTEVEQLSPVVKQEEVEEDQESLDAEEDTEDPQHYVCKICSRDCLSQVSLACHMTISHPSSTNACYICQEIFNTQTELLIHIKDNHENNLGNESFKCSLCNKTFCKQRYLKTHLKRHTGVKNHECPICQWKFFERTKLKWHMETHKDVNQRNLPYKCNVCLKSFYNRPAWSDHMNIHSGQKPFKCQICEASFGHRMGLKRHELVHKKECEFSCNHCGKGFKMAYKLKEHMVRHTGVGDHTCQSCGKVYTTSNSLKRHICTSSKNLSNEDVNYVPVAEEEALQQPAEAEPIQYMCSECNAMFVNLEDAEIHAFSHSTQPGGHQYQIDLGNGSSKLVYIKNNEEAGTAVDALAAIDGGYITYQEDLSTVTSTNKNDEQLVASTLAHLSSMNKTTT